MPARLRATHEWESDFVWQRQFIPEIKHACVDLFVQEASLEEDRHHNTDLIVLTVKAVRIACRIRRYQYLSRFPYDITIRAKRPNGGETELGKIIRGWGDYFFYGFAGQRDTTPLSQWVVLSLEEFRLYFARQQHRAASRIYPGNLRSNSDGSSDFLTFALQDFPADVMVKSSWEGALPEKPLPEKPLPGKQMNLFKRI